MTISNELAVVYVPSPARPLVKADEIRALLNDHVACLILEEAVAVHGSHGGDWQGRM